MIGIHALIVAALDLKTMPVGATNVEEKGIGNAVLSRSAFEIGKDRWRPSDRTNE
jgi:hypothetical protein